MGKRQGDLVERAYVHFIAVTLNYLLTTKVLFMQSLIPRARGRQSLAKSSSRRKYLLNCQLC